MKICSHRTKQEWYHLLTSTGQESNNQSSKQEWKSSSNLLIFLVCLFFVCCFVLTSRIWCFRCLLSYLQGFNFNRDYQCSMSSEIHNLQLEFTFFLWFFFLTLDGHLENPTEINLSRFGESQKQGGLFTVFCARNNTSSHTLPSVNIPMKYCFSVTLPENWFKFCLFRRSETHNVW